MSGETIGPGEDSPEVMAQKLQAVIDKLFRQARSGRGNEKSCELFAQLERLNTVLITSLSSQPVTVEMKRSLNTVLEKLEELAEQVTHRNAGYMYSRSYPSSGDSTPFLLPQPSLVMQQVDALKAAINARLAVTELAQMQVR